MIAATKANKSFAGVGDTLPLRQGAVDIFREASYYGARARPPYVPFSPPNFSEAPRALQDPAGRRAAEAERARRRRNSAKSIFTNSGLLDLAYLRYVIAGEIAGAWAEIGGRHRREIAGLC